jgi:hypothetical protein
MLAGRKPFSVINEHTTPCINSWKGKHKYNKPLSNAGVGFLVKGMLGQSALDKLNALWVKWEYVNMAT